MPSHVAQWTIAVTPPSGGVTTDNGSHGPIAPQSFRARGEGGHWVTRDGFLVSLWPTPDFPNERLPAMPSWSDGLRTSRDDAPTTRGQTVYRATERLRIDKLPLSGANGLLLVGMSVETAIEADYNAWYDREHIPRLLTLGGVLAARRYDVVAGSAQKYLAVYYLDDPGTADSDAWKRVIDTPWRDRIVPHTHDRVRFVGRPVASVAAAHEISTPYDRGTKTHRR